MISTIQPPKNVSEPSVVSNTPVAPTTYKPTTNTVPTFGEQSPSVLDLQKQLNAKGAGLVEDAKYGLKTQEAYQRLMGTEIPKTDINTSPTANKAPVDEPITYVTKEFADTHDMNNPAYKNYRVTENGSAPLTDEEKLKQAENDFQIKAKSVEDTITNIQNGTIPLSAGEQAQVDGLKQAFTQLIEQQKLINEGASGIANVRGFQTGSAEYDPNFQIRTIGSIITAGANKVADLNIKMASAVAELTQAFKDNNITRTKSAWDIYQTASKARTDSLNKTIEATNKKIKEIQDRKQKVEDDINQIAIDMKKNGAPKEAIDAVTSSTSVSDAIGNAGDYLQTASGELGDYLFYKRETMAKGLTPLDYTTFRDREEQKKANREANKSYSSAFNAAKGKADAEAKYGTGEGGPLYAGMKSNTATAVRSKVTKFSSEPVVTNFSTIQEGYNLSKSLSNTTTNPVDDQSLIYAYAKVMDPNSVVKEGEYATVKKYSQSWTDAYGKSVNQAINGTGFLTEKARENIKKGIESKYKSTMKSYDNIYNQYSEGINKITGGKNGEDFLIDYKIGIDAKTKVDDYVKSNPTEAETVAKLYELPGWTEEDVSEYLNL